MTSSRFFSLLGGCTALAAGLIFLFDRWPLTAGHDAFNWISLLFFVLFTLGVYMAGLRAAKSDEPASFIQTVILALMVKMGVAVALILVYHRVFQPEGRWFLLPFFSLYLIYTILETHVLLRLGKTKSLSKTN